MNTLQQDVSPRLPLLLGCPVWNCDAWGGSVYPKRTAKREWLNWYSRMFNTVEGNNSFYAIPAPQHAERWGREAMDGFQFCMKFPREISHERMLAGADRANGEFFEVLRILKEHDRLGPSFLQLSPRFSPHMLGTLESYLRSLPTDLPWAVEVRHLDWFDEGKYEQRLDELLADLNIDKVLFDSRPLYQLPPDDEIERISQTRKPKTPLRHTVTGERPMVRLVGRNRVELADKYLSEWAVVVAGWIRAGLEPVVFTHAPDDAKAPELARRFCVEINKVLPAGAGVELPELPKQPKQLDLFS